MKLMGWGRFPVIESEAYRFNSDQQLRNILSEDQQYISYGLGRSYGDSALSAHSIHTRPSRYFLNFDAENGILTCESGVSLADIIEFFIPKGWFVETTPGTKFVTVGGAIASDVHGKNHHVSGCFSQSVLAFDLMLPDGSIVCCSSNNENRELFRATCGGMGLTGVILRVTIRLKRIPSAYINETIIKTKNLRDTVDLFLEYKDVPYSVAWIDCLAQGEKLGRSLLMLGDHTENGSYKYEKKRLISVPIDMPNFTLNRFSVGAFNMLNYEKIRNRTTKHIVDLESFFYPLDAIQGWNRLYGKGGFTQYQFVLPYSAGYDGLEKILKLIAVSGIGSALSVLKLFGKENENYLSFPMEGFTLALDFKISRNLMTLLDKLDRIVLEYGGRIYLTKDVRMSATVMEKGYPKLTQFREVRSKYQCENKFCSLQSNRLGL